jgi:hypothetical protein
MPKHRWPLFRVSHDQLCKKEPKIIAMLPGGQPNSGPRRRRTSWPGSGGSLNGVYDLRQSPLDCDTLRELDFWNLLFPDNKDAGAESLDLPDAEGMIERWSEAFPVLIKGL